MSKPCGECTECCTGNLDVEVWGHKATYGTPCYFLNKLEVQGCAIYDQGRPPVCTEYICTWKTEDGWPIEMRPDLCGIIVDQPRSKDRLMYRLSVFKQTPYYNTARKFLNEQLHAAHTVTEYRLYNRKQNGSKKT